MISGNICKMRTELKDRVHYFLNLGGQDINICSLLGKTIRLSWNGEIHCCECSKKIKKTFSDGFCYNCFVSAPSAAECIIRPELCRAHLGEGRNVEWEVANHNQPHVVYLAASDAVKVGVTRETQIPARWIDQGARRALKIAVTPNRYEAGMLEVALKSFFTDKTNWQKMLRHETDEEIDLVTEKWELHDQLPSDLTQYFCEDDDIIELEYPVLAYPVKIASTTFEKSPVLEGVLQGIKGQYLILNDGTVFNIRRHTGYLINFEVLTEN